jgi:hypothetical protein
MIIDNNDDIKEEKNNIIANKIANFIYIKNIENTSKSGITVFA